MELREATIARSVFSIRFSLFVRPTFPLNLSFSHHVLFNLIGQLRPQFKPLLFRAYT